MPESVRAWARGGSAVLADAPAEMDDTPPAYDEIKADLTAECRRPSVPTAPHGVTASITS